MFVVAIRVMALALLVLGLWQLGDTLYQADRHLWHVFTSPPTDGVSPLMSGGDPVTDPQRFLIERGCYGAAITVIGLGFAYIGRRLTWLAR